jgi:hypothetical protein
MDQGEVDFVGGTAVAADHGIRRQGGTALAALGHRAGSSGRLERLSNQIELFPMLILINSKNYNLCDTEHECHFGTFE